VSPVAGWLPFNQVAEPLQIWHGELRTEAADGRTVAGDGRVTLDWRRSPLQHRQSAHTGRSPVVKIVRWQPGRGGIRTPRLTATARSHRARPAGALRPVAGTEPSGRDRPSAARAQTHHRAR
jgi:hypothetical protein